jgi:hypothetical protein
MKKCFLVLLTVCAMQTSYSQTEKGKNFIGGQINLSGSTSSFLDTLNKFDNNSFGFSVSPNYGYFIADNVAIGVNVNFGISNAVQNSKYSNNIPSEFTYKSNTLSYGGGAFARYYLNISDKFKFYFNGGLNYFYSTQKIKNSNNDPNYVYSTSNPANKEVQTNSLAFAISPGLVYFITPKVGLHTSFGNLNYNYSRSKNISLLYDNHNNSSSYGFNFNLTTFYVGLNYYF